MDITHPLPLETSEILTGRFWAIVNVEGEGDPIAIFPGEDDAQREIARRRALPEDDDDRLTEYHHALPVHLAGIVWNSYDPDPRAVNPLDADEILAMHESIMGDGRPVPVLADRLREAVRDEREACAEIAEHANDDRSVAYVDRKTGESVCSAHTPAIIASRIRARG